MDAPALRLVIVDDQPVFRLGLRHALEEAHGIQIIGESPTSEQAVRLITSRLPDIALVSVDTSDHQGFDIIRQIGRQSPGVAVVAMTGTEDSEELVEAVRSNARAYISKFATALEIQRVIHRVGDGETPIHDMVSARLDVSKRLFREYQALSSRSVTQRDAAPLSPREMEILRLLGQGRSNKEIGRLLGITEQTVKNHISSMLRKLGVDDRMQAVLTGLKHKWISLEENSAGGRMPALLGSAA